MVLYVIYNKKEKAILKEQKLPEKHMIISIDEKNKNFPQLTEEQIIDIVKLASLISSGKIHVASCLPDACADKIENNPNTLQTAQA